MYVSLYRHGDDLCVSHHRVTQEGLPLAMESPRGIAKTQGLKQEADGPLAARQHSRMTWGHRLARSGPPQMLPGEEYSLRRLQHFHSTLQSAFLHVI